ncbi:MULTISPECIES: glycoside hydrolase family protein [unclassified Cyanobium]|jgi:GH24 family phage-related lysozyme (muramidase)/peptidoglycan hydrolase-like protein with peptidoglycan-binding domain|uniref:glycoside hydrolase family protein n=1 Tax=unclassified Cyanobium TaxID=2627006 RepID=UPI0020CF2689|nr:MULTISPECIES: peptidoglycan-binding protein [unclassified Cyanobium]
MPFITALEDAGLSPDPTAAAADSYVPVGQQLGIDWIRPSDDGALALVCLAGPYTCPGASAPLAKGAVRYLNPARFQIPAEAWQRPLPQPLEPRQGGAERSVGSVASASGPPRGPLPPEVAALTHHYEGCRLEAYPDPKTKAEPITIGWGSTFHKDGSPIRLGDRLSQAEADELYDFICYQRFWKKQEARIPFWQEMNDRQRSALCSFAYNLGADFYAGEDFDTITANLRERDWAAVPGTLMLYREPRNHQVVVGLGRRRRAEGLVWMGADPAEAIRQAEREINSAEDARRWEQTLRNSPQALALADSRPRSIPGSASTSELKLQDLLERDLVIGHGEIPGYPALANQIQRRLIALQLLEPPTGVFGPISTAALKRFQTLMKSGEENVLGSATAKLLIETSLEELPQPTLDLSGGDLAARIIQYMRQKGVQVFAGPGERNIVYVEGMNPDGSLNDDPPNQFNDLRLVIDCAEARPKIIGKWEATTEPGSHYTNTPMNARGAARIRFGQYRAWQVGQHGENDPHEALVQAAPVTVFRDANRDFQRPGDSEDTGLFGINQHWGYDLPRNDIGRASAGCLVGRSREGHREFMRLVKQDPRYKANEGFLFSTTVIPGDALEASFPR